jgi:hypothetical protein
MVDTFTFQGQIGLMTFYGQKQYPIAFTLTLSEEANPDEVDQAAKAISTLILERYQYQEQAHASIDGSEN